MPVFFKIIKGGKMNYKIDTSVFFDYSAEKLFKGAIIGYIGSLPLNARGRIF
jgi:hypothetical protein